MQLVRGIFDNDLQWDHVARLQQTVQGKPQVFQAICASCHLDKSTQEGSQTKLIESRFSKRAWDGYAVTPRPPPLVWQAHTYAEDVSAHLLEIDIRRSRTNALTNGAHEFSVFCVFENILSSKVGELADFSFVSIKTGKRTKLALLPYVGPMWYHRVAVEHMLHSAIAT